MEIAEFLTQTTIVPLAKLTDLTSDRRTAGEDVIAGFRSQIQLRSEAAQEVLSKVKEAERGELLASEERDYQKAIRERDSLFGLLKVIEQRTSDGYRVPDSQATMTTERTAPADVSPVLSRDDKVVEFLERRDGGRSAAARPADRVRFGSIVRALALGNRQGLSEAEKRALEEGTGASGGFTVPEIVGSQFIDRVRNAMVVMRAGAMTVPMTSDVLHLARLASATTAGSPASGPANWKDENALIDETDLTLERVTFTARTLPILVKLSVELSEDSANVDRIIETEMAQGLAVELDRVALLGSGVAPEPRGIRNQSGVGVTSFASVTPDDYDFLIDAIGRVWAENFEPNARITNAALATTIAKFKSSVDSQPLRVPDVVAAVPSYRTNQIPSSGGSPDTTTLFVGDFSQLMIGLRTSFQLEVSRVAGEAFERLQVVVRAYLRADVQLAHPEGFDVTTFIGT